MPFRSFFFPDRVADAPRWRRWLLMGVASLLLHWLALHWAGNHVGPHASQHAEPAVMEAALQPPLPPASRHVAPAPAQSRPRKPHPHKPQPRPAVTPAMPPPAAAPQPAVDAPTMPAIPIAPAGQGDVAAPAATNPANVAAAGNANASVWKDLAEIADAMPAQDEAKAEPRYRVSPPPSAQLKYDVQALREGQTVYGHGSIDWHVDGTAYRIQGDAGILFFTVLSFGSEGSFDDFGVAPLRYSEKRFRKAETATHFSRDERQRISFSASGVSYPIKGGEQDRASIIWQLAGIGRGDPAKFVPGAQIPLFVAGVRDGETWPIQIVGEEDIDTGVGPLHAWHLVRAPRPGSYDQKLDIWLAPQRQWYPVRLRYTDANGDYLDMVASSIEPAPGP